MQNGSGADPEGALPVYGEQVLPALQGPASERGASALRGPWVAADPGISIVAGLQQRLQTGQDLRPAAVELVVGLVAQLVVGHGRPARISDGLDLPRDP